MIKETMTRRQRVDAAVKLEAVDRVPVVPLIYQFVFRHKGIPHITGLKNPEIAYKALSDTFDDLGGYDAMVEPDFIFPSSTWKLSLAPAVYLTPGKNLDENQSLQTSEIEIMTPDDYDIIAKKGWNGFCAEFIPRVGGFTLEKFEAKQQRLAGTRKEDVAKWHARGVPVLSGSMTWSPIMILSMARTLTKFTMDLYRTPDRVQAAMDAMVDDLIANVKEEMKFTGLPWVYFPLERGSAFYYPLRIFERFELPYLRKMINAFIAEGFTPMLHHDTDWTMNLPYLKEFPKGKCICELDSTTDIFKAKEILNEHMCIMGDVPASLLSLGTPDDITQYCEKLIDVVGKGGGFILSTGCECPVDAKFENVKAMIDSVKNHLPG
jgi:hypothetical protein